MNQTKAQPFTHQEQIQVMNACGIPMNGSFDFQLLDGTRFDLQLTPTRIAASTNNENVSQSLPCVLLIWQLQAFANMHDLGSFSHPLPLSELRQVSEVMERLAKQVYNAIPIETLIPQMEEEFRRFWAGFVKTKSHCD
jgi:hypothetical protein